MFIASKYSSTLSPGFAGSDGYHGKKEFLKVYDRLHKKYDFSKTQEILGQDVLEGLRVLEES